MSKKQPYEKPEVVTGDHHLFTNYRLNRMFCSSPDESVAWAQQSVALFEQTVTELPKEKQADLLKYIVAIIEVTFEWGFKQAIDEVLNLTKETKKK